jgi:hypothetical protein
MTFDETSIYQYFLNAATLLKGNEKAIDFFISYKKLNKQEAFAIFKKRNESIISDEHTSFIYEHVITAKEIRMMRDE